MCNTVMYDEARRRAALLRYGELSEVRTDFESHFKMLMITTFVYWIVGKISTSPTSHVKWRLSFRFRIRNMISAHL